MLKPDAFRVPIGESACELDQPNFQDKADHRSERDFQPYVGPPGTPSGPSWTKPDSDIPVQALSVRPVCEGRSICP